MSEPSDPPPPFTPPPPMSALVATGWSFAAWLALALLGLAVLKLRGGQAQDLDIVSGVACQGAAYLLILFLILRVHAPDAGVRDFVGLRPTHPLFYPLALLLGVALEVPANGLYDIIERRFPSHTPDRIAELVHSASGPQRAMIALVVILAGPMLEEILFRGALFRPMLRAHSGPVVVAVTATLFAIAHSPPQIYVPIGIVGLALGAVRRASGSIVPSMLLHATFNAIPFYAMVARKPGSPPNDAPMPLWLLAAGTGAALALLFCVHLVGSRMEQAKIAQEHDLT